MTTETPFKIAIFDKVTRKYKGDLMGYTIETCGMVRMFATQGEAEMKAHEFNMRDMLNDYEAAPHYGPFENPAWTAASDEDKKRHDHWAYIVNGQRFTHPTYLGALNMMNKPEAHDLTGTSK